MIEIERYRISDDGDRAEVQIKGWDGTRWVMSGKYPAFGDDMFRRIIADMLDEVSPHQAPVTPQ